MTRVSAWKRCLMGLLPLLALAAPASAAVIDDFKLAKAIPADAALGIYSRTHEGQSFLRQQMQRVFDEIVAQNFGNDLRRIMRQGAEQSGQDPAQFDEQWQKFNDLLTAVDCQSLLGGEGAFGMKLVFPFYDIVALLEPSDGKAGANFEALAALLEALVALAPPNALTLTKDGSGESVTHRLTVNDLPFPIAALLAREKGVIVFGIGNTLPDQALEMLRGKKGQALAASERFNAAVKLLPQGKDSVTYVDIKRMMAQVREMIAKGMEMANQNDPASTQPQAVQMMALPGKMIDQLDIFDYSASTSSTDGMQTTSETVTAFKEGAADTAFYKALFGNAPIENPLKFVPKGASNFSVSSGFNLTAVYAMVLDFIRKEVPDGEAILSQWDQTKLTLPVDIEQDLLSWIGGGMTMFTMAGEGPYAGADYVVFLNVKDEAKAKEVVNRWMTQLGDMLAQQQQGGLADAKVDGAEGFKTVNQPFLAMMNMQPVIGFAGGNLVVALGPKSASRVSTALKTAAGAEDNFSKNERFVKEGLQPTGKVYALSYGDLSKFGAEMSSMLQSISGMMNMFGGPQMAKDPTMRTFLSIMTKVGKVMNKLDFLLSSSSQATMKDGRYFQKTITHYQEPPKPKVTEGNGSATTAPAN